jgi:outer membrane protein assembly factor BamB
VVLENGMGGIPMSTSSPVVYNGRAYVGVSGTSQFGAYSGHNITVIDLGTRAAAYQVQTQGYPQTSGLLTTAYEAESGYVYIYFFDNMTPGKLRVLRDRPGMTVGDYLTTELGHSLAYALFTPTGEHAQYAIAALLWTSTARCISKMTLPISWHTEAPLSGLRLPPCRRKRYMLREKSLIPGEWW